MLDRLSVPRRSMDFEDYVDIFRRNIRWIIGPAFAGIVISTVVAFLLEDTYQSVAIVRITPQQISGNIVQNIAAQNVTDRVQAMAQSILSRSTMTNLITTNGLYKEEQKREPMEDVLTTMREAIKISPVAAVGSIQAGQNVPAIQVQFSYRDRLLAHKVCDDLVTRLMAASTDETLNNANSAVSFLKEEYESAKRTLEAADQKLQDYKMHHPGELPDEQNQNMAAMSALNQRLGAAMDAQTRNSEQRMMYETQLQSAKNRLNTIKSIGPMSVVKNAKLNELDKEIEDLNVQIASMSERYKDDYPELVTAKDNLAILKKQREEQSKTVNSVAENSPEAANAARERTEAQAQIDAIQTAMNATKMSDTSLAKDIAATNGQLRMLEARLAQAPAGEKDYIELVRERETAKLTFDEKEKKLQLAKDSARLQQEKQGETLELIDAASTPTTPTAPKRTIYVPMGLAAGLAIGFVLVAIREVRDTSLKNLKDARLYTNLSILGSIPLLENDVVVQRRKQVMWVGWATATLLGLAIMAGSVAHYFLSRT